MHHVAGHLGSNGAEAIGFLRAASQPDSDPRPYLQISQVSTTFGAHPELYRHFVPLFGWTPEASKNPSSPLFLKDHCLWRGGVD